MSGQKCCSGNAEGRGDDASSHAFSEECDDWRTDDHRFRELLSGARCTPEKGYIADCTQRNECARADLMECGLLLLVERVQQ